MFNFRNFKIITKLRIFSLLSIIGLIILGSISNYFYNTAKTLSLMVNSERVHNNTFQQGIEDFYKFQISGDTKWIDSSIANMEAANQMARYFGTIDEVMQHPKDEVVDLFYTTYKEAYYYDRSNARLMFSRLKILLILKPAKLVEAQKTAMEGALLGDEIKNNIINYKANSSSAINDDLTDDLAQMRNFYSEFAAAVSSLTTYANKLLGVGISLVVFFLILIMAFASIIISNSITVPINKIVRTVDSIAKGNLNTKLSADAKNEIGDLSAALNKMVIQLKESRDKSEQDSWFKSGINLLNEKLSGDQEITDISSNALSFMMTFLHSQLGSIHLYDSERQHLKLLSSSGFDTKKLKKHIPLNDGIIGQAAFSKQMVVLSDIPDELYVTYSSAGEFKPKQIIVVPLLFNETLIGVIELSSMQSFSENELEFVSQASEIIAINLNSSENTFKTNELLKKTQDQASELQVQQEELRVANEELVEQTKVLTENEKKLQVQQEELRVANEELEGRTRQLEIQKEDISNKNNELRQIRDALEIKAKELELASQYKSEFLANMSHELRTPLNSLLILSNVLAKNSKGNLTADQIQSMNIIHKSGTDLLYLINDVLDLSKIEAGKVVIELETINAIDLKNEVLMTFNATAEDKDLSFNVHIDDRFPAQLNTDRYRLMQILKNLLSNAFKFTSKGAISVDFLPTPKNAVFKTPELTSENTCCIKVSDTGVGIPEEKLEAIFEAFQQADGSISRKFGGTGLGLSISRELIKMLSGELQLTSKINEGSTFFVYLPAQNIPGSATSARHPEKSQELKIETPQTKQEDKAEQPSVVVPFIKDDRDEDLNERTVLIIHPSKEQAGKFLQQARSKNYRAIVAENILNGIVLAKKYHPKAIMLAVELADAKDSNYQNLKSHPSVSKLPVHLITPIDYDGNTGLSGLHTLETIDFADALKSLEDHLVPGSKRILIVEDNVVTLKVVRQLLSELDIEIEEAKCAEEAYKIMVQKKFDCVILDLGLPDYSGKELLEKMEKNNITIPKVMIYTGKDMSKEEIKELNDYTDTIILKGLKSDERLMDEVTLFLHQVSKTIPEMQTKTSIPDGESSLFKGKKILVVDDEIRNVFALGKILEERDIEVFEAENGKVAIDVLMENKQIDLVLMDVMMPVMDG
ncbi:MAG TPA: hypothetical protein DIW50_16690, partial [Prolixibacteraceae bacterium]|nr:hypothetical protein [Prolixibacteraceae bacterium]